MTYRTYNIESFLDGDYSIAHLEELDNYSSLELHRDCMRQIDEWMELRASDEYLILLGHVLFKSEKDATLFTLGFQFHDYKE